MSRKRKVFSQTPTMSESSICFTLNPEKRQDIETLFSKTFQYQKFPVPFIQTESGITSESEEDPTVEDVIGEDPGFSHDIWQDDELMCFKQELNCVKDRLSGKDIEIWHSHTTKCNLAGRILSYVKSLEVELCTQAWVKFYEVLTHHRQLVPNQNFLSLHLCEAPGAFIASLNHFLQLHAFSHRWAWRATTLNPYHEGNSLDATIPDDRLIRHTYQNWIFGPDGSGDVMKKGNLEYLERLVLEVCVQEQTPLLLVTADGSKDCQENPAEQEALLSKLHYCEMISACFLLAKGGSFVLKMFTMYESSSVVLMFMLNILFKEVNVIKPATSKSGNSEVYLVCLDYKRNVKKETLMKLLQATVYSTEHCLVKLPSLPPEFLMDHKLCCRQFAQWQTETILRNLNLFDTMDKNKEQELKAKQALAVDMFIEKTAISNRGHVFRLHSSHRERTAFQLRMSSSGQHHPIPQTWSHKYLKGTFQLRQNRGTMPFAEKVKLVESHEVPRPNMVLVNGFFMCDEMLDLHWSEVETGYWCGDIRNSRFCSVDLLQDLSMIISDSQFQICRGSIIHEHVTAVVKVLQLLVSHMPFLEGKIYDKYGTASEGNCASPREIPTLFFYCNQETDKTSSELKLFLDELSATKCLKLECVSDATSLHASCLGDTCAQLFCDMTAFFDSGQAHPRRESQFEELFVQKMFLNKMLFILKNLQTGSSLILLTSTFLTRLSAGYLYILARSFQEISVRSEANLWLHQFVVLDNFQGIGMPVIQHLEMLEAQLMKEEMETPTTENCIMAVMNTPVLLADRKFVQFVTSQNNFALSGFVNLMLEHYKRDRTDDRKQVTDDVQHKT